MRLLLRLEYERKSGAIFWTIIFFHLPNAIGQVRYDTALLGIPVLTGRRERPGKYGDKFTPEVVVTLPKTRERIFLYGKWQWVHYRSAVCLVGFVKGRKVRAIWM